MTVARGPQPDPAALDVWRSFLEAHARVTERLDAELRAAQDLPLVWYDVLVQLSEAGGRLRMSELADAVLLSRSNCTRLVDRLDAAGLVARAADPGDARVRWAVLTERGLDRLRAASGPHLEGVERAFTSFLDSREAATLTSVFCSMIDALRRDRDRDHDHRETATRQLSDPQPVSRAGAARSTTGATSRRRG